MPRFVLGGAVGAALAYLFDPDNGRKRRKKAIKRAAKTLHQTTKLRKQRKPRPDDVTLARKVESEIFRDAGVPKGQINVNVEDGVVYLRGELEQPDLIEDLGAQARKVKGVRAVENLLHVPGEEAPAKAE